MPLGNSQPLLNTCPSCQEIIDVSGVRPYEKIHCPLCDDTIRVRTVFSHFTLKAEIGQGGMSRVFRAVDNKLGREVALKILHSRYEDQPQIAAQFEREAKLTASINHPHVVKVYSAGKDQGYFYIAMELLPSKSLEQLITERGRIPEAEALRITHEVALGLAAAFQLGLIHRDVKPGNILLDHDGSAKLVDFGLALMQGTEEDPLAEIWATPFYVPPEKLWDRPEDFRSDMYSLGATLYHMIAGCPPHSAETDSIQELITIKSQPLDLRTGAAHMHEATVQLISRMMSYDPPSRHGSYEELLAAIDAIRKKLDPPASPPTRFPAWAKVTVALAAVATLGSLSLLVPRGAKSGASAASPVPALARPATPLLVSAEETSLSQLLPKARDLLLKGDAAQAVSLLQELSGNESARPEWRSWAAFHLGLERLLQGDLEACRTAFHQAAGLSTSLDPELKDFFAELAQTLASTEPPPGPRNDTDPLPCLRSLALGLKSWLADDFGNASRHLTQFSKGKFSGPYAWLAAYQPRAESIQKDATLLAAFPKYNGSGDIQSLTELMERLATVHKQLHEERSKASMSTAIAAVEKRIADQMEAAKAAASNQAVAADIGLIRETRRISLEKGAQRHFAEAAAAWKAAAWGTDDGRKWAAPQGSACEQAGRFLDLLASAFSPQATPYEGEILRTEGRSFTAKVLRITRETLIVDLGFGPTPLKMETISSQGIFKIAQATVLAKPDPSLGEAACFFAWYTGQELEARQLAETLQGAAPFQERWEAVTRPVPNP